jgi:hypothetical protein
MIPCFHKGAEWNRILPRRAPWWVRLIKRLAR